MAQIQTPPTVTAGLFSYVFAFLMLFPSVAMAVLYIMVDLAPMQSWSAAAACTYDE